MSEDRIYAPWSPDQIRQLNRFQRSGIMHPFTCPMTGHDAVLVATSENWVCPQADCDYTQDWAHNFMADGGWISEVIRRTPWLSEPEETEDDRMLDVVAQAIWRKVVGASEAAATPWDTLWPIDKEEFERDARAALEALRNAGYVITRGVG